MLVTINQHTTFEVPNSSHSKDMIRTPKFMKLVKAFGERWLEFLFTAFNNICFFTRRPSLHTQCVDGSQVRRHRDIKFYENIELKEINDL